MHPNSKNGLGLTEVLIAAVILGFVAMMGARMFTDQVKSAQTVGQRFDITSIQSEIRGLLSDSANCTANFHNYTLNNSTTPSLPLQSVTGLINSTGNLLYVAGRNWGGSGIKITSMSFGGASMDQSTPPLPIPGRVNFTVTFSKPNTYGGGTAQYVLSLIETPLATNPTKLDTCYAVGGTPPAATPITPFGFAAFSQYSTSSNITINMGYHRFCAFNGTLSTTNGRVVPLGPPQADGKWQWTLSGNSPARAICYD